MARYKRSLWQITAPHFCAGLLLDQDGICYLAAPILSWAVGKTQMKLETYFRKKNWEVQLVERFL